MIELLTREQVAELLGITAKSLSNSVSRGLIPAGTRIAGIGLRWRKIDVEKFIADQFKGRSKPRKVLTRVRLPGESDEATEHSACPELAREADAVFSGGA